MIRVKWIAYLILAFLVPMFIFVFNKTPNYSLLRFHHQDSLMAAVTIAILMHFGMTVLYKPEKVDPHI